MDQGSYEKAEEAFACLKAKRFENAIAGIILGTGLSGFVNEIKIEKEISYGNIPHFPISTVESHPGKLIYGTVENQKVIAMQGRFHYYEGYSFQQIVFPVRVLKMLGIKYLLLSNAAGAINLDFKKGNLMLINDHINLLPSNPLIVKNDERFGTRFPDMSAPYDKTINEKLKSIAHAENITLYEGVYAAVPGPNLETRAEYRYLKKIGADAVGMSTVPEVIAASHLKLPCAAVSVLTDECDPDNLKQVDIKEIIEVAGKAEGKLSLLFKKIIREL
ncbi:MAG TPA: purine-nucleoside phosphorylase [Bacteroidia bacterium]|nr:purine-nucleoside phosphorylase [Bacteroidia bacterium]